MECMQLSPECSQLFNKYKLIKQLAVGVGTMGTLYEVINTETKERSVLKVVKYASGLSENEVRIACLVSTFPGFIKLKSWFVCESVPSQWLSLTLTEFDLEGKLMYLEMQRADGSLHDLLRTSRPLLTQQDIRSILFEITVGLYNAQKYLHLCHRDIKLDNILYIANTDPRKYDGVTVNSVYQPLIADFGNSTIQEDPCLVDLYGYRAIVIDCLIPLDGSSEIRRLVELLDQTADFGTILQADYFQPLRT